MVMSFSDERGEKKVEVKVEEDVEEEEPMSGSSSPDRRVREAALHDQDDRFDRFDRLDHDDDDEEDEDEDDDRLDRRVETPSPPRNSNSTENGNSVEHHKNHNRRDGSKSPTNNGRTNPTTTTPGSNDYEYLASLNYGDFQGTYDPEQASLATLLNYIPNDLLINQLRIMSDPSVAAEAASALGLVQRPRDRGNYRPRELRELVSEDQDGGGAGSGPSKSSKGYNNNHHQPYYRKGGSRDDRSGGGSTSGGGGHRSRGDYLTVIVPEGGGTVEEWQKEVRNKESSLVGPRRVPERTVLLVRKIPPEMNRIDQLHSHFSVFGTIVTIQICYQNDPESALVQFSNSREATAAIRSTEAVLGNRFIKVFWAVQYGSGGRSGNSSSSYNNNNNSSNSNNNHSGSYQLKSSAPPPKPRISYLSKAEQIKLKSELKTLNEQLEEQSKNRALFQARVSEAKDEKHRANLEKVLEANRITIQKLEDQIRPIKEKLYGNSDISSSSSARRRSWTNPDATKSGFHHRHHNSTSSSSVASRVTVGSGSNSMGSSNSSNLDNSIRFKYPQSDSEDEDDKDSVKRFKSDW